MASRAHCFFCFEVLSASFERRDPPTLPRVIELYDNYSKRLSGRRPGEREDAGATSEGEIEDEDEGDGEADVDAYDRVEEETQRIQRRAAANMNLQNPSISRIQQSSSSSRSSSTSSPSGISASSSSSHLTTSSSATSTMSTSPSYASRVPVTESYPLFVTWNTASRSGTKSLRGCIGTFEALPLSSGLSTYALTSAFDDTRFSPIPASLLPALSCSLTLLADFESCRDAMDWTLGMHGLRISFTHRNRRHGATYLPDAAVEQGWSKEETVESLMKKAGWDGGYGHGVARRLLKGAVRAPESQGTKPWEEVQDFRAVRYTGLKASANYSDWKEWQEWTEKESKD